jgi:hypothetical protein
VTLSRGPGTWSIANAASPAAATYPSQSFAFTSAVTIQGYYVTDVTGANVVWAEAFPAPVAVSAAIGLAIIPRFGLGNVGTGTGPAGP